MLVITRKAGQAIQIGDVKITLLCGHSRTRLGIEAPKEIKITRLDDLNEEKRDERKEL